MSLVLLLLLATGPPPDRTAEARRFVDQLARGDFAGATAMYDDAMRAALPEPRLREAWSAVNAQAGPFQRQEGARVERAGAYQTVFVTSRFEKTALDIKVVFDDNGRVAGLFFAPTSAAPPSRWEAPGYCRAGSYTEREVTAGDRLWPLPGTLSLPAGRGPHPALVLVHGSGPQDRDETLGPNKPFADLACGLATRGVAVLRYDKRSLRYGTKLLAGPPFTVKEEVIDDALAAVDLLRADPAVDPKRVYLLGHSLGGMLAPRIAQQTRALAGLIVLAGNTRPLPQLIVRQLDYINRESGGGNTTEERVERMKQEMNLMAELRAVESLTPEQADSTQLVLGAPPAYWLDLRAYQPAETARGLTQRLLVLQGERDYQVTMDDFKGWQQALRGRANATLKSYPDLDHLLIAGKGSSLPADYQRPGHVAEPLVDDIADWVKR
jgi:fermentation-respiration switch protein FrsA (DUF1100 family)